MEGAPSFGGQDHHSSARGCVQDSLQLRVYRNGERRPSLLLTKDLVSLLSDLQAKGVDLFLFQQGLDTSTPSGRAMFQMLGVFSEFEAAMIRERVRTGITRAKRNGTKSGRPIGRPRLGRDKEIAAQKLLRDGMGILKVARTLKIGTGTVSRISAQLRK